MKENDLKDIDFDAIGLGFEDDTTRESAVQEVFGAPAKPEADRPRSAVHRELPKYYFFPTWRSQLMNIILFGFLCILAVVGSRYVPALVIAGSLFKIAGTTYYLYLPILALIPGIMLGKILVNIYDAKYIIDDAGVEAQVGLVSFNLRQPRLRWEDIRGVEPTQTIWERLLGIGNVYVGSAAAAEDVEIVMAGVANPRAIQLLIGEERARRLKQLQTAGLHLKQAVVMSD